MGFLDNFKEKATDLVQAGAAQSKRLAEIAKLKTANLAEEDAIKKAYVELGKLYYAEKGATPEAAYAVSCEKITAARAAIEANNDRIAELKEKDGEEEYDAQEEPQVQYAQAVCAEEEPAAQNEEQGEEVCCESCCAQEPAQEEPGEEA